MENAPPHPPSVPDLEDMARTRPTDHRLDLCAREVGDQHAAG